MSSHDHDLYKHGSTLVSIFVAIGSAVPVEKIFEGILPYIGMAAIWLGLFIVTLIPPPIKFDVDRPVGFREEGL